MTTKDVAVPAGATMADAHRQPTQAERIKAFSHQLEAVDDPRCPKPIPRFMLDMPWTGDDDEAQGRIIARLLAADDPYEPGNASETLSGKDLVGRKVVVHDMRVAPSDKKGGWGAYLICDVTVDDSPTHEVMTMGAKEPVSILAYAWFNGDLPLTGTVTVKTTTAAGNTVLGFQVERGL